MKSKNNLDFAYATQKGLAPWLPLVRTMSENKSEERNKSYSWDLARGYLWGVRRVSPCKMGMELVSESSESSFLQL